MVAVVAPILRAASLWNWNQWDVRPGPLCVGSARVRFPGVSFDDLVALFKDALLDLFLRSAELTREELRGFYLHGVPHEWAVALEKRCGIPLSAWPKVLRPPKLPLSNMQQDRSMLGSKMELRNADAKSTRVKIAAGMTDNETPARKAILDANVTPQDIAKELGVGRSTVNAWCNGTRSIPTKYREALARGHGPRKPIRPSVWSKIGS